MLHHYPRALFLGLFVALFSFAANAQVGENVLENFETIKLIDYDFVKTAGAMTPDFNNPAPGGVNTSAKVGKYVRGGSQFDALVGNFKGGSLQGINAYVAGTKKFSMNIWSPAPIGTGIEITLQVGAIATGPNYPAGRHSIFRAVTTKRNEWEKLVFDYTTAPAAGVDPNSLDQIVITFNNPGNSTDTYFFDDLAGPAVGAGPSAPNSEFLWTNFFSTNNIFYRGSDGAPSKVANPAKSAAHIADSSMRYVRSAVQYDVLRYGWKNVLQDLAAYRTNTKKFSLNVFSPAANTTVQFTLQDSTKAKGGYPAGRYAEFLGTTKGTGWERVTLTYSMTPDAAVPDASVNELAVLFNSNTTVPVTVYLDSIFGPKYDVPVAAKKQATNTFSISPNPAHDMVDIALAQTSGASITISDLQGRTVRTVGVAQGQTNYRLALAGISPGIYTCHVHTSDAVETKKLLVQ